MMSKGRIKTPKHRSEKAHVPPPPKKVEPRGLPNDPIRGEEGQFTGQESPGIQKK